MPMKRRNAVVALATVALAPFAVRAQLATKLPRIAFLGLTSPSDYEIYLNAFLKGLRELGYEDRKNIVIEYRWAEGREDRLPELAAQLVRLAPDMIVSHAVGVAVVQRATSTIPIVMGVSSDPVGFGFVKSLAKPGGNITGVASRLVDVASKRLELLKEAVPALKSVAVVSNPALPTTQKGLEEMESTAKRLGIRVRSYSVTAEAASVDAAFAAMLRERPEGLVVQPDPITGRHAAAIAALAAKHQLPSIGGGRQYASDGGFASYGPDFIESWRLAARYVDRILKGAKPADLPVEQLATFELVINLKTDAALRLTPPNSLMLRATDLIR